MTKQTNKQSIRLFYRIDEYDKDNNLIRKGKRIKSESFIRAFAELLNVHMASRALPIRDTGNIVRTISTNSDSFNTTAGIGNAASGIVVGSGTIPVTTSDFNLAATISHGSGAGQLAYSSNTVSTVLVTTTNTTFITERTVRNDTIANITINEIGIICLANDGQAVRRVLIVRDIIAPRTLLPQQTFNISYEFEFPL